MNNLTLPATIICTGATMCGKTHLTKRILNEQFMEQIDYLLILSPTVNVSNDWDEFPENHNRKNGVVIKKYESGFSPIIREVIDDQKTLLKTIEKSRIPNIMLIIDDCVGEKIMNLRGILDKFSTRSRHWKVSMIILSQKLSAVPRTVRLNTRYCILFSAVNYGELEKYIAEYVPSAMKKTLMKHLGEIYDKPYNFILTDNFEQRLTQRLWLNGEQNIYDMFNDSQ